MPESQFARGNTVIMAWGDDDGSYKFFNESVPSRIAYPLGTYPASPYELGSDVGYSLVHRPQELEKTPKELARRVDFHQGVLHGMRCAVYVTRDLGEE